MSSKTWHGVDALLTLLINAVHSSVVTARMCYWLMQALSKQVILVVALAPVAVCCSVYAASLPYLAVQLD